MSSTPSSSGSGSVSVPGQSTFTALNFTGGFPDASDLAPSIVFFVVYALSVPVLLWRMSVRDRSNFALLRPMIFVLCRLGTLGLRAVMSRNAYNIGELIAELILVSIGYLFLISTTATLFQRNVSAHLPPPHPAWVPRLSRLTQLVIIGAIATAIAGGASTAGVFDDQTPDPSKLSTVRNLRHASVILALIGTVLVLAGNALTQAAYAAVLPGRQTTYLYVPGLALLGVSVYRVCQNFMVGGTVQNKAVFWVVNIFLEMVAYVSFIAISIPEWYPEDRLTKGDTRRKLSRTEDGDGDGDGGIDMHQWRY